MDILDALFDGDKPGTDESDIPDEKTVLDGHDAIKAMMSFGTWKGAHRTKSTLTLYQDGGEWGVRMVDGDNRRSFAVGGKDLAAALASLESVMATGKPNWYYWPKTNGAPKSKKSANSSGQNST